MFYLTTHSTHFIYGYMASEIWLRTILIVRKETRCRHIGYSYRLTARVLLYAPSHRQDNTYHGLCYASRGALAGTRNSSMRPVRGNVLTTQHLVERLVASRTYSRKTCTAENRADGRSRIYRRNNEHYAANCVLEHGRFGGGGSVMVSWTEIHHDGRTALVRVNGTLNAQIYRDEILQHHVVPLINVTGGIFQHDNARSHTLHESVEIFYSNTTFMSYHSQQDRAGLPPVSWIVEFVK